MPPSRQDRAAPAAAGPSPASSTDAAFWPSPSRCRDAAARAHRAPGALALSHLARASPLLRLRMDREGWRDGGDGGDGEMEEVEGRTPAHFSSSGQGQAEGRGMPVSHPAHHHIASTCVGERRSRRRAGGTSSQARRLCCSYCRYYRYCHLGLGWSPMGVPQGGQFCPRGTCTSSRASRLRPSPSPQNSPASSRLCASPHHWLQCQPLLGFIFESEAREVPFGGKRKKASFSRSTQKAKFLPRNISERSGVPLPVAPASSRTHFPLFILKIFLR